MPPAPGKKVDHTIQTSGNRHKKGGMRVCVKINLTLTCEPEEAEAIAQHLADSTMPLPEHLKEMHQTLLKFCATTDRKKRDLAESLETVTDWARMSNRVSDRRK